MLMFIGSGAGGSDGGDGGGGWLAQEVKKTAIETIESLFTFGLPPIK
jgi:hypothetical protein